MMLRKIIGCIRLVWSGAKTYKFIFNIIWINMYIMFLDRYISIYILHIFHVGRNTDGMGWGGGRFNKKKLLMKFKTPSSIIWQMAQ